VTPGPVDRAVAAARRVGAVVRRRQQEREPRVVLYDRAGHHPRVLAPGAKGYDRLLEVGAELVELALEAPASRPGATRAGARE
jgi:hypothetical protein